MALDMNRCAKCLKVFSSKYTLKSHIETHLGIHQCLFCNKGFISRCHLFDHYRTHINEKPHFCDLCDKTFAHVSHVSSHMKSHTVEKPFSCNVCRKCFLRRDTLMLDLYLTKTSEHDEGRAYILNVLMINRNVPSLSRNGHAYILREV